MLGQRRWQWANIKPSLLQQKMQLILSKECAGVGTGSQFYRGVLISKYQLLFDELSSPVVARGRHDQLWRVTFSYTKNTIHIFGVTWSK